MNRFDLEHLWAETLKSPTVRGFDRVAAGIVEVYSSGDPDFDRHIRNRLDQVSSRTGHAFDPENLDIPAARAYIADEVGFESWAELVGAVEGHSDDTYPILFQYLIAAMERGDFSALESVLGSADFHSRIMEWYEEGMFVREPEALAEVLSASCMLGQTKTAEYLIDKGIDPYAGMRTWLAGPHYAASSGRLETVKMLLRKNVPLEVENRYGGTLLGQALWSAINEHTDTHAEIVERLIDAGAHVWPGTLEWWEEQAVPSATTKSRVADALRNLR